MTIRNDRVKSGQKWCSYNKHWARLSKFRKSTKGKHLPPDASGHYITYCRECESKQASIRQARNYVHKRGPRKKGV